jgi:Ca2+-binding RTX toxin-like protein
MPHYRSANGGFENGAPEHITSRRSTMAVVQPKIWGIQDITSVTGVDLDTVATLPNGGYVTTWRQNQRIAFQLYDGKGDKVGGTQFVASPIKTAQFEPDVLTYRADGSFIIAWTEASDNSAGGRILRSQSFDINGVAGAAHTLNTTTQDDGAKLSGNDQNNYAAVYIEDVLNGTTHTPTVRFIESDPDGHTSTPFTIANTNGVGHPDLTRLGGPYYVVSFLTLGANSGFAFSLVNGSTQTVVKSQGIANVSEAHVVALRNSDGSASNKFQVVYVTSSNQIQSKTYHYDTAASSFIEDSSLLVSSGALPSTGYKTSVTALKNGGYAIAYVAGSADIWVKVVDADGTAGTALQIASNGEQVTPSIAEMTDGRLSVSWHNRSPATGGSTIETTVVDARATAVSVTGTTHNDIYAPSVHGGDSFDGGDGIDTLTFQGADGAVAVNLAAHTGTVGIATGDTYTNFENLIGSNFADILSGDAGVNRIDGGAGDDVINGGAGADVMNGGAGNDVYRIDDANDQVVDASGVDTVVITTTYDISRLSSIENITGEGAASITLTGNAFANIITGNDGANVIKGGAGNDTLFGGGGNDRIHGEAGKDVLFGGTGHDIFVFDTKPNKTTNVDKIMDFNVRDDSIYLENKFFKVGAGSLNKPGHLSSKMFYKGAAAHDADDRVFYNPKNGNLYLDDDGNGAHKAVLIATLVTKPSLTVHDLFVI